MKAIRNKKIMKGLLSAVLASAMVFNYGPMHPHVHAETLEGTGADEHLHEVLLEGGTEADIEGLIDYVGGVTVDAEKGFTDVLGNMTNRADSISDPLARDTSDGRQFLPSDYVFLGENSRGPILWRVLDTDLGTSGSDLLLLSEYLMSDADTAGDADYDALYLDYFSDAEKDLMVAGEGGKYLFALTAEQVNQYLATYNGAPLKAYTDASRGTAGDWWLASSSGTGQQYVSVAGEIGTADAVARCYNRVAVQISRADVVYAARSDGGWRLSLLDSDYEALGQTTQTTTLPDWGSNHQTLDQYIPKQYDFSAWITNIDGTKVEVSYVNAKPSDAGDGMGEYISAVITDSAGKIKYYSQLKTLTHTGTNFMKAYDESGNRLTPWKDMPEYDRYQGSVSFDTAGLFDSTVGDKIFVFWEKTNDSLEAEVNPALAYETSYASRFVELCFHTEGKAATCSLKAFCSVCEMGYGDYEYVDLSSHVDADGHSTLVWTQKLGTYVNEHGAVQEGYVHSAVCSSCNLDLPIDGNGYYLGAQPCYTNDSSVDVTCVTPGTCDACKNSFTLPYEHEFSVNGDGICSNDTHVQEPVLEDGYYLIKNEGNLIWYQEYTNREEFVNSSKIMHGAKLMANIDFSVLSLYGTKFENYNWTPIGVKRGGGYHATFDGNGYTISNLNCISSQYENVAFIGFAEVRGSSIPTVKNVGILNSHFENTYKDPNGDLGSRVAAIVGYAQNGLILDSCYVQDTTIDGYVQDPDEGAGFADAAMAGSTFVGGLVSVTLGAQITNCAAINLEVFEDGSLSSNWIGSNLGSGNKPRYCFAYGDGAGLFCGDATGSHSYYLTTDGATDAVDNPKKTAEQFASGMVAYYLYNADVGYLHSQHLGYDDYPVLSTSPAYPVYQIEVCDESNPGAYTYSNRNEIQHTYSDPHECGATLICEVCNQAYVDNREHSFTAVNDKSEDFIWTDSYTVCQLQTYCEHCGKKNPELIDATVTVNYNGGIRADYMAKAVLGGVVHTSDVIRIPVVHIQDTIGITASSVIFDGKYHVAKELVTNTRMGADEFDAYFILDGDKTNKMPSVKDVGVYDLYVVGKGNYAYQEYVFEDLFTIEKAVVDLTVSIPERVADNTTEYTLELDFSGDVDFSDLIDVITFPEQLPKAEAGEYTITITDITYWYEDEANLTINLQNTTAIAKVLPRNYVEVVNKDYELEYTYTGNPLPAPTAANFTADAGSELSFAWYKDGMLLKSAPVNAGDYTLVVSATATDEYIASVTEFPVFIGKAEVTLGYDLTGLQTVEYDDITWYVVPFGQPLEPTVSGLVGGDTIESAGLDVSEYVYDGDSSHSIGYDFPTVPNPDNYKIQLALGNHPNYEAVNEYNPFYFIVPSPDQSPTVRPLDQTLEYMDYYDGAVTNKGIDLLLTWNQFLFPTAGENQEFLYPELDYTVALRTADGDYVSDKDGNELVNLYASVSNVYHHTPVFTVNVGHAQVIYVTISANGKYSLYENGEFVSTETVSERICMMKVTMTITDESQNSVTQISDPGTYTVRTVTQMMKNDGTTDVVDETIQAVTHEATVTVLPQKTQLWLIPMEGEINLDGEAPKYDPTKIVSVPGYSLMPGHKIVDVIFDVDTDQGSIKVEACKIEDAAGNDVSHLYYINDGYGNLLKWYDKNYEAYGSDSAYKYPDYWWSHKPGFHGTLHVYSNACDTTCNLCDTTRTVAPHTGGTATCNSEALCDICGQQYGGYSNSNHAGSKLIYVQNQQDFNLHDQVYACCGAVVKTETHTITSQPTCADLAVCQHCGVVEGSYDVSKHVSEETYYRQNPVDATKHDLVHACCDNVMSTENHAGSTATCTARAVCETCGLEYGELDPENHVSEDLLYEATAYNTVKHDVLHACCRGYIKTENHSGGTATCTDKAVCQHCGIGYGGLDTENHASADIRYSPAVIGNIHYMFHVCCGASIGSEAHTGGEAVCNAKAQCTKCGDRYGDLNPAKHASSEYVYRLHSGDHTKHDKYSACCDVFIATEEHSGGTATCRHYAECDHCGEGYGEKLAHTYDSPCDAVCNTCSLARLPEHFDNNGDKICDGCGRDCSRSKRVVQASAPKREDE